ncbi:MAG TPA: GMC family oxidoreductase [Dehalococcoidia bacterium]|nr:GMC family oxidoreductase [Dehalococcoidia bacterium]
MEKEYDYIVVGTGPGGATVAKELTATKKRVLMIEYGPRLNVTGFMKIGRSKVFRDDDNHLLHSEEDIWIGRARMLGGSSYVAMGNAVTPPDSILNEWGIDLSNELESARKDLRVNLIPESFVGPATRKINQGAFSLGWEMKPTPKCVDFNKCKACGMCMFGCSHGAKWTTLEFIEDAMKNGADLLLDTEVKRVTHQNGKATGVIAVQGKDQIDLHTRNVVLAAGGIGTPIILQNSDINEAGRGLALDIFQTTYGYSDFIGMKNEIILATYLEKHIEEKALFAAPYMYLPILVAMYSKDQRSAQMNLFNQMKLFLESTRVNTKRLLGMMTKIRDERTGRVMPDGRIHKTVTEWDKAKLGEAHEINKQILIAAGAKPETIFHTAYESGHPACTAAIGEIIDRNQETQIKGLFVSDASAFPTPLGIPPILTIVALSKRLANHLISSQS